MVNNPLPEVTDDGEPSEAVPPNAAPPAAESSAVRERTVENSSSGGSAAIQVSNLTGGRLTGAEAMNVQVSQSALNDDMQKNDSADIGLPPNLTCDGIETEKCKFKVPSKRKQSGEFQAARAKKLDVDDVFGEDGMDSGSESSDSSVGLSQSDLSSSNYGVDDIKLFLRATKNKREMMRCFGCGALGHAIRSCPNERGASHSAADAAETPPAVADGGVTAPGEPRENTQVSQVEIRGDNGQEDEVVVDSDANRVSKKCKITQKEF
ncbi:hypothetical protein ROHU_009751 [Labeo rohita]|uniref:CCHC-type domain-containing protein n=1 Tax=Labeo rohita TaxID=84645 RepID=A0A498LXW8_LABRO|nr:hypothetical protein ROHU_009751 [Labeo rohita]